MRNRRSFSICQPARLTARRSRALTSSLAVAALCVTLPLAGCGTSTPPTAGATSSSTPSATRALTVENAWVKTGDSGMTAVFGQLHNSSAAAITITSATTTASMMAELHEVVMVNGTMQMQPKKGGFVIPAGGSHALAPGGDHIMVMNMTKPIRPGDTVDVTLTLADGSKVVFSALGKDSTAGKESYVPTPSTMSGATSSAVPSP